ncbi:hypothetical protein BESB_071850 [Besnoitia besnoiti]|uniref:Transmembrane protein n=1 Tax=Besnoitia besnoiti TaxID=94643 RepID=A0A2A9MED5_BESBE|nr:uncharacterized protein BESB_071850 [Besnoitia besnoiti]PFH34033.1 hypothetical protein BESB_071850 [Besnoitia besnoiti]
MADRALLRPVFSVFSPLASRAFSSQAARAVALPRLTSSAFFAGPQRHAFFNSLAAAKAGNQLRLFSSLQSAPLLRPLASQANSRRFFSAAPEKAAPVSASPRGSSGPPRPGQLSAEQFQTSLVEKAQGALGVGFLHPTKMVGFAVTFLLNLRFYFMYMARTTFQAVRPLLAFSVFGEVMKLVLATMSSGLFSFLFSFVLAFEVFYFFLQCYISYTFLTMFFTVLF